MKSIFYYALVARGTTPLAEYSLIEGNHRIIALRMLELVDPKSPLAIVEQDKGTFYTLTDPDGMSFLCLCNGRVLLNYLQEFVEGLRAKWQKKYGNDAASFAPDSKNNDFGENDIRNLLDYFNKEIENFKYRIIDTPYKEIMYNNLSLSMSRGPQLNITEIKPVNEKTNKICHLL